MHRGGGGQPTRREGGGDQREVEHHPELVLCATLAGFGGDPRGGSHRERLPGSGTRQRAPVTGISAAVIGGTLLVGGYGTVVGGLIGALFLGVVQDGLNIKGVNANYVDLYLGLAILIAMTIDIARIRAGSRHG